MRRRLSWLLLLSTLVTGALACQGSVKDPIGDYPRAGDDLDPISDFPGHPTGAESEEFAQDAALPSEDTLPTGTRDDEQTPSANEPGIRPQNPETRDSDQVPPVDGFSPPAAADAGVTPDGEAADAAQNEADAGEAAPSPESADAGVAAP